MADMARRAVPAHFARWVKSWQRAGIGLPQLYGLEQRELMADGASIRAAKPPLA
jgi:hypothetical protein